MKRTMDPFILLAKQLDMQVSVLTLAHLHGPFGPAFGPLVCFLAVGFARQGMRFALGAPVAQTRALKRGVPRKSPCSAKHFQPLQECSGSFSLSGIKVQSTQMEEDVRLETLFVPIAKGLFDQPLDFIV